jgi:hypothetical protein
VPKATITSRAPIVGHAAEVEWTGCATGLAAGPAGRVFAAAVADAGARAVVIVEEVP